jgi:hypothetical protein
VQEGDVDENADMDVEEEVPDEDEEEEVLYSEIIHQKDYRKVNIFF